MEIKRGATSFYVGNNEQDPLAILSYENKDDETIVANRTFVAESLRGQGVAGRLFKELINYAEIENKKIIPECSYVKVKMERTTEYDHLLAK